MDALAFSPNCAPFSVFPFSAKTCVELMIGAKLYAAHLNFDAVAREFRLRDWDIQRTSKQLMDDKNYEQMLVVRKGPFHMAIPPADFMRMQLEALRPKTLIEACEVKYRQGPGDEENGYLLGIYQGENALWN